MKLTRELAIEIQRQKTLAARQRRESLVFYILGGSAVIAYFVYRIDSSKSEKEFFYLIGMLLLARFLLPLAVAASFSMRQSGLAACPVCHDPWGLESVWSAPIDSLSECEKCQTKLDQSSLQNAIDQGDSP